MYFHRANKIKPAQLTCLEGIQKATEILECTICNSNIHLTITGNLIHSKEKQSKQIDLLRRPPIRHAPDLNRNPEDTISNPIGFETI